jgi:hypothetical protein
MLCTCTFSPALKTNAAPRPRQTQADGNSKLTGLDELEYERLLKKLPMTKDALDKFEGNLAQLLADIIAESPEPIHATDEDLHETSTLVSGHVEFSEGEFTLNRTLRSETRSGFNKGFSKTESTTHTGKLKRIGEVAVKPYPVRGAAREFYEIYILARNEASAFSTTYATTYPNGRVTSYDKVLSRFNFTVACEDDQADAIGQVYAKLISQSGGQVTFKPLSVYREEKRKAAEKASQDQEKKGD